jgi:membrane protein DedA with SNARE-associated domain
MMHWFISTLAYLITTATPMLRTYGLFALVGILFIENLGIVFAPGEAVIVTAGFLAAKGVFPIWLVIPLGILAAVIGGYVAYALGARYGHKGLLRYGHYVWIKPPMVDKAHRFFHRFGAPVVAIGRFIVPLRQLQGYIAGSADMGFPSFAIWSAVGGILWVCAWSGGAYMLAAQIPA